jgi:hypothetical protein
MATIMSGLEGQGDFSFGAGAIQGFDLAGMIRNFDASFRGEGARTVYDSVTANFTISQGVVRNDDLLLDAPWGGVEGAGSVDLGARTVEYRLIPGIMRDATTGEAGIAVPILVSGSWSALRFRPDLEYLAEQEFLEQRTAWSMRPRRGWRRNRTGSSRTFATGRTSCWAPISRRATDRRRSRTPCKTGCRRRPKTCYRACWVAGRTTPQRM